MWTNPMYFGEDHIYFDEQLYVAGDFDFQIRFATIGKIKILDEILGEYFSDDSGLSTGSILQSIEGQLIYQRYNVIDKKIFFFPFLFFKDRYYPHFFKIDHTPHSLEEVCVKINFIRKKNGKRKKRFISYILDFKTLIKMIIKKNILHRK
jgi:hypothetical protein